MNTAGVIGFDEPFDVPTHGTARHITCNTSENFANEDTPPPLPAVLSEVMPPPLPNAAQEDMKPSLTAVVNEVMLPLLQTVIQEDLPAPLPTDIGEVTENLVTDKSNNKDQKQNVESHDVSTVVPNASPLGDSVNSLHSRMQEANSNKTKPADAATVMISSVETLPTVGQFTDSGNSSDKTSLPVDIFGDLSSDDLPTVGTDSNATMDETAVRDGQVLGDPFGSPLFAKVQPTAARIAQLNSADALSDICLDGSISMPAALDPTMVATDLCY